MVIVGLPLGDVVGVERLVEVDAALARWLDAGAAGVILDDFDEDSGDMSLALARWRRLVDNSSSLQPAAGTGATRAVKSEPHHGAALLAVSSLRQESLPDLYCDEVHMILNHDLIRLSTAFDGQELFDVLKDLIDRTEGGDLNDAIAPPTAGGLHPSMAAKPAVSVPQCLANFVIGTGGITPFYERFEPRPRAEAVLMFAMTSAATPIVYYGDEYAKKDSSGEPKERRLRPLPEPSTGRMDWDDAKRAQLAPEFNVFKLFQRLSKLRQEEPVIRSGTTAIRQYKTGRALAVARIATDGSGLVVASNFGLSPIELNLSTTLSNRIPSEGTLVIASTNSRRPPGQLLPFNPLHLAPSETLLLRFSATS